MPGVKQTMHEYKHGELHSGSKTGPLVHSRAQAIAIALHESGKSRPSSPDRSHGNAVKAEISKRSKG